MKQVLITTDLPREHFAPLAGLAELHFAGTEQDIATRDEVMAIAPKMDAIINLGELKVDASLLDAAPKLAIVANVAIGYDNLDGPLMASRGVWATNTPNVYTKATADLAMALLLGVVRRVPEGDTYCRSGQWKRFQPSLWEGTLLEGKTMGIIGYGEIGKAVAKRAAAFDMNVIFHSRTVHNDPGYRTLDVLLAESDAVCLNVPLTPETNKLINAGRLAKMKRGAILINVARGKVVDEAAMIEALRTGQLGGAGLDVFENEPAILPGLLAFQNVVMTPHVGGGTRESRKASRILASRNIAEVFQGRVPITPVNRVTNPKR